MPVTRPDLQPRFAHPMVAVSRQFLGSYNAALKPSDIKPYIQSWKTHGKAIITPPVKMEGKPGYEELLDRNLLDLFSQMPDPSLLPLIVVAKHPLAKSIGEEELRIKMNVSAARQLRNLQETEGDFTSPKQRSWFERQTAALSSFGAQILEKVPGEAQGAERLAA
jgi:hypothetical protein